MNVILLEKIGKLGGIGDTASVKSGYARNFLFPQGKAIPATRQNLTEFESRRADLMAAHDKNIAATQKRADKVTGLSLSIQVNASDEGKLFGSVGTKDIADAINAEVGSDVTKAEVLLPHGVIRELGDFNIALDLGYEVGASIKVSVQGLDAVAGVSADGSMIEEIDEAEAAAAAVVEEQAGANSEEVAAPTAEETEAKSEDA
jgi:large subunit ribosomal protein L9